MTELLSRWPVVIDLALRDGDRDADELLTVDAIERLLSEGTAAYARGCTHLDLDTATVDDVVVRPGVVAAPGPAATVGVAVVEVFPDHCTVEVRIRPLEGAGIAGTATCSVRPEGGISDDLRAELIARAHAAHHLH